MFNPTSMAGKGAPVKDGDVRSDEPPMFPPGMMPGQAPPNMPPGMQPGMMPPQMMADPNQLMMIVS